MSKPLAFNPFAALNQPETGEPTVPRALDAKAQMKRWENLTKGEIARLASLGADKLKFAPVHLPAQIGDKSLDTVRVGLFGTDPTKAREAYVHLWFNEDKKGERKLEFVIKADGRIEGKIPSALAADLSHEKIMREVLEQFEGLKLEGWHFLDKDVLPPGQLEETRGAKTGERRKGPAVPSETDPRRVTFYGEQRQALLKLMTRNRGAFNGYYVIVFPGFVLLDNVVQNNADYFIDGTPETIDLPIGADEEEIKRTVEVLPFSEWLEKPKKELRRAGFTRIQHKGDTWEKQLQAEIDRRLEAQA
jgi:hypothetical protein